MERDREGDRERGRGREGGREGERGRKRSAEHTSVCAHPAEHASAHSRACIDTRISRGCMHWPTHQQRMQRVHSTENAHTRQVNAANACMFIAILISAVHQVKENSGSK